MEIADFLMDGVAMALGMVTVVGGFVLTTCPTKIALSIVAGPATTPPLTSQWQKKVAMCILSTQACQKWKVKGLEARPISWLVLKA